MLSLVYADTDAVLAYLFQGDDIGLFAVSLDKSGQNIPRSSCPDGWRLQVEFRLAVHEPLPTRIAPEPVIRGIRALGYYIWRDGSIRGAVLTKPARRSFALLSFLPS